MPFSCPVVENVSFCDVELRPVNLSFELNLGSAKLNYFPYLCQRSFHSIRKDKQTHNQPIVALDGDIKSKRRIRTDYNQA